MAHGKARLAPVPRFCVLRRAVHKIFYLFVKTSPLLRTLRVAAAGVQEGAAQHVLFLVFTIVSGNRDTAKTISRNYEANRSASVATATAVVIRKTTVLSSGQEII